MPERSVAGRSIVTRRAIVDIVRIAVQGSYGVTGFSDPSFGRRLLRWIGLDRPGIRLTTEGGLTLDVFITVSFGVPVAEVARQVDSAVRYSLRQYLGAEVASLAIHVDGLRYQPSAVERAEADRRLGLVPRPAARGGGQPRTGRGESDQASDGGEETQGDMTTRARR
jgi:uncharacterized alkaline shock family protein YloU